MDVDKSLDTYALVEISKGNPDFADILNQDFVILDLILTEFYGVLLREQNEEIANLWYKRLESYVKTAHLKTIIKAVKYRQENKKQNLSFFDCVGYMFALDNNMKFVTGDKEFKDKIGVEFVK